MFQCLASKINCISTPCRTLHLTFGLETGMDKASPCPRGARSWGKVLAYTRAKLGAEPGAQERDKGRRGLSGRHGRLPDLKRLPPTWSGAAPGNLILLVFVFLQRPRSPWPPQLRPRCSFGLLPLCICTPFLTFLRKAVACS